MNPETPSAPSAPFMVLDGLMQLGGKLRRISDTEFEITFPGRKCGPRPPKPMHRRRRR